jgi:hypothetical protein
VFSGEFETIIHEINEAIAPLYFKNSPLPWRERVRPPARKSLWLGEVRGINTLVSHKELKKLASL